MPSPLLSDRAVTKQRISTKLHCLVTKAHVTWTTCPESLHEGGMATS